VSRRDDSVSIGGMASREESTEGVEGGGDGEENVERSGRKDDDSVFIGGIANKDERTEGEEDGGDEACVERIGRNDDKDDD